MPKSFFSSFVFLTFTMSSNGCFSTLIPHKEPFLCVGLQIYVLEFAELFGLIIRQWGSQVRPTHFRIHGSPTPFRVGHFVAVLHSFQCSLLRLGENQRSLPGLAFLGSGLPIFSSVLDLLANHQPLLGQDMCYCHECAFAAGFSRPERPSQ